MSGVNERAKGGCGPAKARAAGCRRKDAWGRRAGGRSGVWVLLGMALALVAGGLLPPSAQAQAQPAAPAAALESGKAGTAVKAAPTQVPEPNFVRLDIDSNFDGIVDQRQYFEKGGKLARVELDEDQDGIPEQIQYYDGEDKLLRVEFDTNKDKKIDQRQYFRPNRVLLRSEIDTNHDGSFDRVQHFNEEGRLERVEIDTNNDGKPDQWEYYQ